MKIIFSPTKSQKKTIKQKGGQDGIRMPFPEKTSKLVQLIQKKTFNELQKIFKTSDTLTTQVYGDYQNFGVSTVAAKDLFTGTSFKELSLQEYTESSQQYMAQHLRILSALYGVLVPDYNVSPYRLDMSNHIGDVSLYDYWYDVVAEYFQSEDVIINLASNEYAKMLAGMKSSKIITIEFLVEKNGTTKSIAMYSKKQRGKMLDWMITNKITDYLEIKKYSSDRFVFSPEKSSELIYIFIQSV